jgi:hypothetical protein
MFVQETAIVDVAWEQAASAFRQLTADYAADRDADLELRRIGFEMPPLRVRRRVDMAFKELEEAAPRVLTAVVEWRAAAAEGLFPVWEGRLEIAAHGSRRTRLTIHGNYFPPLGAAGEAVDQALMNRVARASISDFLERLAADLGRRAASSSSPASDG